MTTPTSATLPDPPGAAPPATTDAIVLWVRIGLIALAVPQLLIGVWAIADPSGWYQDFPGFDPRLVAAAPPFNEHLASDAGAGFLATGVGLALAAWWADRRVVWLALIVFMTFSIPHAAYHWLNPSRGLTSSEDVRNTATLVMTAAFPLVLLWGSRSRAPQVQ
jgi:hypothetical protein